jgi:hypothetical protein
MYVLFVAWLSVVAISQCLILATILLNLVDSDKSFYQNSASLEVKKGVLCHLDLGHKPVLQSYL